MLLVFDLPELSGLQDVLDELFEFEDDASRRLGRDDVSIPLALLASLQTELSKAKEVPLFCKADPDKLQRIIYRCTATVRSLGRRYLVSTVD